VYNTFDKCDLVYARSSRDAKVVAYERGPYNEGILPKDLKTELCTGLRQSRWMNASVRDAHVVHDLKLRKIANLNEDYPPSK
jgi:hypothetical protein